MILIYGFGLGAAAFALQWLQYQYLIKLFPVQAYMLIIALAFTILGVWAGNRFTPSRTETDFTINRAALKSLGVTAREYEVLQCLAAGQSNKQIAQNLGVSLNTIKTHITSLFTKLTVARRTQAVQKARSLRLIP